MGLMRLWGAIRALTQTNAFEDEDDDEDSLPDVALAHWARISVVSEVGRTKRPLPITRLKIEQRRLRVRFVAFCFASRRFGFR
jgi:hypothetical protein